MKKYIILFLFLFLPISLFSQTVPPKREFRAAWIATVINLDWPSSNGLSATQQKQELINILNELKRDGLNAVIFQIRSECDAMYNSSIDPWSYWLTGKQGTPPSPYYDPLQFAIEETHKRGMELHAWFNPYRVERSAGGYVTAANHVSKLHPDWVLKISTIKFLDPGLPMVRNYVSTVVYDVVNRYDVDGVHFDDYFYPYEGISTQDTASYRLYPRGFTNKDNWRRDNVNLLIKQVNDTIHSIKPWVKFGMSPFGIWKNGVPSGIIGLDAYSVIYCDAIAWLHDRSIDYLTPQLYWKIGGNQDYNKLQKWWADSVYANKRHFYPGKAPYRVNPSDGNWSASEIPNQIRLDRANPKVQGSIFFRAKTFNENYKGVTDSIRNDLYRNIAILPTMNWKDVVPPNPVQNLRFEKLENGQAGLTWDLPQTASDGDSAFRYVVYRFEKSDVNLSDLENSDNIYNVEGSRKSIPGESSNPSAPSFFVVTALDRNYNESTMSSVLQLGGPAAPALVYPISGIINLSDTITLKWNYAELASSYRVQISTDVSFASDTVFDKSNILDTLLVVTGLEGQTAYYWRVNSKNAAGSSNYSEIFSFKTGHPANTYLVYPPNNILNIPVDTTLYWNSTVGAETYNLLLARSADYKPTSVILDITGLTDTTYHFKNLEPNALHYWKIRAVNKFGFGNWSESWRFKTNNPTGVEDEEITPTDYALEQNYPNPFNPTTKIRYSIPSNVSGEIAIVTLKVYDMLGNEVATLVNKQQAPGIYEVEFSPDNLASGVYMYKITVFDLSSNAGQNYVETKKMIYLK